LINDHAPFTHDLRRLAKLSQIEFKDRLKNINKVSKKDFKTIILSVFFSKGIDALTISKLLDYL